MHIEGSYEFEFERELVWEVLMDIDVLGSIIPAPRAWKKSARISIRANCPFAWDRSMASSNPVLNWRM